MCIVVAGYCFVKLFACVLILILWLHCLVVVGFALFGLFCFVLLLVAGFW